MASRASYPDVDRSLNQISFQVAPAYQPKSKKQNLIHHQRLNLSQLEYDFSLETEVKEVFQRVEEENDRLQKLEIESEKETNAETELKGEGPPPVPKRDFEKDPNAENDSGVSSGGENHNENSISTPLQPTLTSSIPIRTNQNRESSSVLDIFDVSRDDPFEKAQLNSIDEKELLAQVFPPSHNNNNKERSEISPPKPKPRKANVVSGLRSMLDAREERNHKQKTQNFSKSAMAALNSLPVITPNAGSKPSVSSRPSTPIMTGNNSGNSHLDPNFHKSLFPSGTEEFGASLTQMGYDKIITAKAIQLFGKDEHKCIDFLSAYSDLLSSNSGASPGEILKALQVCEYSKDETLLFLQKSKRYLEMGFEHLAVRNAIIKYPNEPAFVLESLMTHHSK